MDPKRTVDDLEQLLELERRLESIVADARREAERITKEADAAAAARADTVEAELVAAAAALDLGVESERRRREAELESDAVTAAARYEAVTPERVAELSRFVVERLLADERAL